jgi:phosphatidylinositol 4-kinase
MSNMYSLLNYIAATSKEITESSSSNQLLSNPIYASSTTSPNDNVTFQSDETGLHGRSDEEKRLIKITTISVVTRLAFEFHTVCQEEVTEVTISMLLQRLRTSDPTLEAAIASDLVDLALVAPEGSFIDVARAFSLINRATGGPEILK